MSQLRYTRIQGVNFPPSVPSDFADQIRGLLKKYNQVVDDNLVYHETILELRKSNESLKKQNKSLEEEHDELKQSYESLKELSEKVVSKYEMQILPKKQDRNGLTVKELEARYRRPANIKRITSPKIDPQNDEFDDQTNPPTNNSRKSKQQIQPENEEEIESSDEETIFEVPSSRSLPKPPALFS
jgi:hypothetical protein